MTHLSISKPNRFCIKNSSKARRIEHGRGAPVKRLASQQDSNDSTPTGVCSTCGVKLEEIPNGCDQKGRIAGGIGAVAGFEWWPIKAYRPCPALTKSGLSYNRKGQVTDEMLFGKGYKK
eukprot:TRINITY_DN3319_c0_g1_i1.p2 TRINITY_DN3319_c0_g1~~TRINITY_DN3319_c0_g1_i1.p2  ORF type:complete len:119 (-),score=13.92 TRINITY_DN3319_c0_g1_i1:267-623(-)